MPWNLTIGISHADYTIIVDFEFVTHDAGFSVSSQCCAVMSTGLKVLTFLGTPAASSCAVQMDFTLAAQEGRCSVKAAPR